MQRVTQRLRGGQHDVAVLRNPARTAADGEIRADRSARRRPAGARIADVEAVDVRVREPDAAAGHDAVGFVSHREVDAAAAAERIARIEIVVEIGEGDLWRVQRERLRASRNIRTEPERAFADGHATRV
jgi:hypothetical protein